jgi:hypothetical protein
MAGPRTKRILLVFGLFLAVVVVGAGVLAFMVSRDVPFDWENPNFVEASEARRKLKLYDNSVEAGSRGFVRLSQVEINSYLMSMINPTNKPVAAAEDIAGPVKLQRAALNLTSSNMVLHTWGEARKFGLPLRFVVQRGLRINQRGTAPWEISKEFMKIGELEVSKEYWPKFESYLEALDKPLLEQFKWTTNIQAILVAKNEVSQRPEFRLYTYKPIPAADRH